MIAAFLLTGPAWAVTFDFTCTSDAAVGGLGFVGLPPVTVTCEIDPPSIGTWDQVSWTFGDGQVQYGDTASYTYDEVGQYTVSAQLDGYVDTTGVPTPALHPEQGYVTLCGPPEPAFSFENKGGLAYEVTNTTSVAPFCLDDSQWSIFRGRAPDGDPVITFDTWDGAFELPAEGAWTIVLDQTGLAGQAESAQTLQAKYQLAQDLTDLKSSACATGPLPTSGALALVVLALVRRRR